jgi:WD40 repeat protein
MRIRPFGSFAALVLFGVAFLVAPWLPAADETDVPPGVICVLKGHKEAVYGVAFSPDGKFLLTASGDPSVKVWQLPDGKEIKSFAGPNGHKQIVLAVAVSPDGSEFATAGADNTAKVWDFPTSKHLREFVQGDLGRSVAVSNDGTRIAAGDKDGKVKIWNAADGKLLHDLAAHKGAVTGLAFSPNGQALASCSQDSTLRFWNVVDGKPLGDCAAHAAAVTGVAYGPGGGIVFTTGADQTLKFWTQPPVARRSLTGAFKEPITALSLSPDGSQVAAASDKGVRLSTLTNGQTVREITGATGAINTIAVSPGNTHVAAGTADRRLILWQTKDGAVLARPVAHGGAMTGVAFNGPGTQLATVGKDGMLRMWTIPPVPERSITEPAAVRSAVLSANGKQLATGGADKLIRLYNLDNLKAPQRQFSGHTGPVNAVALSADGKMAVSGGQGVLRFWDLTKGEQSAQIGAHTGTITSLSFAPGGSQVLSASADGSVKLFAMPTATNKAIYAHAGIVTSATLSPDGTRLLTGCSDNQVRQWNLANGQVERTWAGPTLGILAVAYSPAGNRVAAGSADKLLTVWEATSNKEVKKMPNLAAAVHSVALSSDGKLVAAGLADGSVRVYDLTSGKEIHTFPGPKGEVSALLFTAKGDQLISGAADGSVQARVILPKLAEGVKWKHSAAVHALALSKDGTHVAVGGADKQVKVNLLATGKEEATFATPAVVRGLAFHPDGKRLAVAGADGQARIYGTDGQLEEYFAHEGAVHAVAYSTDGKRLFTAGADKTARSWTPSLVWRARHDGAVQQAIYSPRGDRVLSAGADGLVRLWAVADGKPIQAIRAHTGAVAALSISADAGKLATVGADKAAQLYDLAKLPVGKTGGKELDKGTATMTLPAAAQSVSLSPNGLRIAIGFPAPPIGKETVRLYDAVTGKEILDLGDQDGLPSRVIGFQADNRTLLVAGEDRTARLEDVNVQSAFEVHPGGASAVAYHSNGTQILTGGADKTVKLWTIATSKLDRTFGPLAEAVTGATFSRDFTQVAATAGKTVAVWETATGKPVLSLEQPTPAVGVSFSADRTRIATGGEDGRARVWDVATKKELQGFLHDGAVAGVAYHPTTPNMLITGSADKTVGIHTVTATRIIAPGKALNGLTMAPNATHVLTADGDGKVTFWNIGNGVAERSFEGGDKPASCVTVSRNGQLLAVGGADKKLRLFNFNLPKVLSVINAPAVPRALAFSNNNQALVAAGEDGSLTTYDVTYNPGQPLPAEFGKVLQTYAHATEAADVAFPGVGSVFYSVGADKLVKAWKLASDSPTRNFPQPNSVNALAYDQDGKRLVTGCSDGRVRIYDLVKGALLREIVAHNTPNMQAIYCVAFSPDGKQVVSGSIDQTLKLWDAVSGKQMQEFKAYKEKVFEKGHQEAVLSAAFSPDGKQIVSGGMDRTIKVWNVADGNVLREFTNPAFKAAAPGLPAPAHPGWVYAVRFVEGGKKIVSAGGAPRLRGYLATWDAASGKLLFAKEMGIGTLFTMGVSADGERLALGTGGSVRTGAELNQGIVIKTPK